MTQPDLQLQYAKAAASRTASMAAQARAQMPKRFMSPLPMDELEDAMNSAHLRLAQLFEDNFTYLDTNAGGFMSKPGRERLAHYQQFDPWFIDYAPYPVLMQKMDADGELVPEVVYLAGTPGPYLQRLMDTSIKLVALPALKDYSDLMREYAA